MSKPFISPSRCPWAAIVVLLCLTLLPAVTAAGQSVRQGSSNPPLAPTSRQAGVSADSLWLSLHYTGALFGYYRIEPEGAYTKELVMEHAREVILLADRSKAHKISFTRAGRLEKVRVLITDRLIDRKLSKELRKRGMEVVLA